MLGVWERQSSQIVEMWREGYSLQQIGDAVGVTRERIRQLLEKHAVTKPSFYTEKQVARLIGCSTWFLCNLRRRGVINPKRSGHLLYSVDDLTEARRALDEYRQEHSPITLKCKQCGRDFQLKPSLYRARLRRRKFPGFFCSRRCMGKWSGAQYGFRVHQKNRKWDWGMVWQRHLETGYGARRLSRQLGIPESTISEILHRMTQLDYNSAIAQLWGKYRREKTQLIAKLRKKYEEEARRLYEKYRDETKKQRKEDVAMRFPTELAAKAREVEPNFPMGLDDCQAWLKDHPTCEGCQHYDKCQYFGLGILVAIGRTEEILNEMKGDIGQKSS